MGTLAKLPQIDRDTLYNEVWSTPMTQLGVKYGVTGPDIKKQCVELQIPCPRAGYWSRLRHGYPPEKPPLPPLQIVSEPVGTTSKIGRPRRKRQPSIERLIVSTSQSSTEETADSPKAPPKQDSQRKWHPVVKKIRDKLLASVEQAALQKNATTGRSLIPEGNIHIRTGRMDAGNIFAMRVRFLPRLTANHQRDCRSAATSADLPFLTLFATHRNSGAIL
ncbi:hypothetical protein HDG37_007486 [Paraburkholderia sp. MM5384-R2]|nr:hypothetical protein [Paraburkholderia sp. MM5384-R2]